MACRSVGRWDSVLFCVGRRLGRVFAPWRRGGGVTLRPSPPLLSGRRREGGARFKRGKKQKVVEGGRGKNGRKTTKTRRRKEGERETESSSFLSGTLPAAELWIPLPWFFLQRGGERKEKEKKIGRGKSRCPLGFFVLFQRLRLVLGGGSYGKRGKESFFFLFVGSVRRSLEESLLLLGKRFCYLFLRSHWVKMSLE